jgi:hypothetical protein
MLQILVPSSRAFIGAWLRRSLLVGVGMAAVSLALAPTALASTTIGNNPPWTFASGIIGGFGYQTPTCCTATYGQTVTVPATDTTLDSFTFYVDLPTNLIFRGEVYAWNPTTGDPTAFTQGNATGPALYGSSATHTTNYVNPPTSVNDFQLITFNTGGIPLTAGAQYVLFFTVSKDYQANAPTTGIPSFVGYTNTDTIPGGDFVFINNGGDTTQWTTMPWTNYAATAPQFNIYDLAFTASFSPTLPTTKAECMNGGWKTYGVFKNQGDCVSFVASGGRPPA